MSRRKCSCFLLLRRHGLDRRRPLHAVACGIAEQIHGGATLKFTVECLKIGEAPPQPNIFKEIDHEFGNKDGKLAEDEIKKWFKEKQGADMPAELMTQEDQNKDGFVSWDEFSGPKGDKAE